MTEHIPATGSALEQYQADYGRGPEDKDGNKESIWKKAFRLSSYINMSDKPAGVRQILESDPNKAPLPFGPTTPQYDREVQQKTADSIDKFPFGPVTPETGGRLNLRRQAIVNEIEDITAESGSADAFTWLMNYDINDLRLMRLGEAGIGVNEMFDITMWAADKKARQDKIDLAVQDRMDASVRSQALSGKFRDAAVGNMVLPGVGILAAIFTDPSTDGQAPDEAAIRRAVELEFSGQGDKAYEPDISKWRDTLTTQLRQDQNDAAYSKFYEEAYADILDNQTDAERQNMEVSGRAAIEQKAADAANARLEKEGYLSVKADKDIKLVNPLTIRNTAGNDFLVSTVGQSVALQEANLRQQIADGGNAGDLLNTRSGLANVTAGGLGLLGWGVDKVATGVGTMLGGAKYLVPAAGTAEKWLRDRAEQDLQENISLYENMNAQPDAAILRDIQSVGVDEAWNTLEQDYPEEYSTLLEMSGGDQFMAYGFFASNVTSNVTAKDQISLINQYKDVNEQFVQDIQDQDFRLSGQMLDLLSMYGRNVPGRISTAFSLLLTDADRRDELTTGQWMDLWDNLGKDAEKYDFTPSKAVGLDGSVLGLVSDLGLGIAFDPTTWIFGPRMAGEKAGAALGTVDEVTRIADSALMRKVLDNIVVWNQSSSRGAVSVSTLTSWLPDAYRGNIYNLTGIQSKVLPARDWVEHSARTGGGAMEVGMDFLRKYIPKGTSISDDSIKALADDIAENGFREAGEIVISRTDQTLHFADGVKRFLAAEEYNKTRAVADQINRIPVRLRVTDDASAKVAARMGPGTLKEYAKDGLTVKRLKEIANKAKTEEANLNTFDTDKLATKIKKEGFDKAQPIEVSYNRVLDQVTVTEGNVRLAAAELAGIKKLPVKIVETTSDLSVAPTGLPFESPVTQYTSFFKPTGGGRLPSVGTPLSKTDIGLKRVLKDIGSEDAIVRPDSLIPGEALLGKIPKAAIKAQIDEAIFNGARIQDGISSTINSALRGTVKDSLLGKISTEVKSFFTQANTVRQLPTHGPGAIQRIIDQIIKISGDDIAKADEWVGRIIEYERSAAAAVAKDTERFAILEPMLNDLQALIDETGGALDGFVDDATAVRTPARIAQEKMSARLNTKWKEVDDLSRQLSRKAEAMPDQSNLVKIVGDIWDDFNRTQIAPKWSKQIAKRPEIFDEAKGIVKWEYLRRGFIKEAKDDLASLVPDRDILSSSLKEQALAAKIEDPENLIRFLNGVVDTPMSINLPMSPLDMIAASTVSGRAWTRFTQKRFLGDVRNGFNTLNKVWRIDKVATPRVAMVTSADEVTRILQEGGKRQAARYIQDKMLFLNARISVLTKEGLRPALSRDAIARGSKYSERLTERLRALSEGTVRSRQFERLWYDDMGGPWQDYYPGESGYRDIAQQWFGGMMGQTGFRRFLAGKEEFRQWYFGADGEFIRDATVYRNTPAGIRASGIGSFDDLYEGWRVLFEDVVLGTARKNGKYDEVLQAFKDTAASIEEIGGSPRNLPDWVLENTGPVRGVRREPRARLSPLKMTDEFFNRAFLDPVNYRQSFVSNMTRSQETARLESLFASQGKRVMSDTEVANLLGYKGLAGANRVGVREFISAKAMENGIVTRGYIDDLVQRAADKQMDHMLYVAERGSRVGRSLGASVFPFGKPAADMMAYWGRELFRRPALRGYLNEDNFGLISDILTAKGNFNPRAGAFLSRLSTTDFTIDRGYTAGLDVPGTDSGLDPGQSAGIFPGTQSSDLSPLFFLPTGGENPSYSLIPGVGYLPLWGIDMAMAAIKDPLEDPEGYQALVDSVGEFIQGAKFGDPRGLQSATSRVVTGGTVAKTAALGMDAATAITGKLFGVDSMFTPPDSFLGSPSRNIARLRMTSALMADPSEMSELLDLESGEEIDLAIKALIGEASVQSSQGMFSRTISGMLLPTKSKFSSKLDEIKKVWLGLPQLDKRLGTEGFNYDAATVAERVDEANKIREKFFNLPDWEQDIIVAGDNGVEVNMVSSWQWDKELARKAGIDTSTPYRTDGSTKGLAKHLALQGQGIIRPADPETQVRRYMGLKLAAKRRTAQRVYEVTISNANDSWWEENVSNITKDKLDTYFSTYEDFWGNLGIRSSKEMWLAWGRYEGDYEKFLAQAAGVEAVKGGGTKATQTSFDIIRKNIKIPTQDKPWSPDFPGIDLENFSAERASLVIQDRYITPQLLQLGAAAGIDVTPGMTLGQIYTGVQAKVVNIVGPASIYSGPDYDEYIGTKSNAYAEVDKMIISIANNQNYSEDFRNRTSQFYQFENNTSDRYRNAPLGVSSADQLAVQDKFMTLMNSAGINFDENNQNGGKLFKNWQEIWNTRYRRNYGELNWSPPEPLSPFDDNGDMRDGVWKPFFDFIIDGDSMKVKDRAGAQTFKEVRLLGVRARDYGLDDEGAAEDKRRLQDAIAAAANQRDAEGNPVSIYFVRDKKFGNLDQYGRELVWLWIGDTPFYFRDEMLPNRDPSGGN